MREPSIEIIGTIANQLGEGPCWHGPEQALYWVDALAPAVHRLDAAGKRTTWAMPEIIGSFVFRRAGTLTRLATFSALPQGFQGGAPWASEIRITPDGRFLYVSERRSSTIAIFKVDGETGNLSAAGHVPTEEQPRGFAIDPRGRFLVAVGQTSHSATLYAIDPETGALKALNRYPMGRDPNWVEIVDIP